MLLLSLIAQASDPVDTVSVVKWAALAVVVITLINGPLWTRYLKKELNREDIPKATKGELEALEKWAAERFASSETKLNNFERLMEERVTRIYDKMQHDAELIGKTIATIARDVSHVQGHLAASAKK